MNLTYLKSLKLKLSTHIIVSVAIRLIFIITGEIQDQVMIVKYTDIDYHVFTDAAVYVSNGSSPFLRHTYRYTPLLAYMLIPNVVWFVFGKILFSVFDVLTGYLIYKYVLLQSVSHQIAVVCAAAWWYNPLSIAISTRGSAESIMSSFVLITLVSLKSQQLTLAGIMYGISVHFKIYPIIYSLPIYITIDGCPQRDESFFCKLLPSYKKIKFIIISVSVFAILTVGFYFKYGEKYLNEAYLYHIIRRDTRHNFSVYFYMLYLNSMKTNIFISVITFLPQGILLISLACRFRHLDDLPFCAFCQTFIFVSFNKVCTSQYFLWYLCLLPPIAPHLQLSRATSMKLISLWAFGQGIWLFPAYYLEIEGVNTFKCIWIAGLIFFVINLYILSSIIKSYKCKRNFFKKIEKVN